jgi:hypothetical protein
MPTELHRRKPRLPFDPKMFGLVPGSRLVGSDRDCSRLTGHSDLKAGAGRAVDRKAIGLLRATVFHHFLGFLALHGTSQHFTRAI